MSIDLRNEVRGRYRRAAAGSGCGCERRSESFGYDIIELDALPSGADLGLGCGNPTGVAKIKEGETVLDLGSGGGIDCFLAAKRVGPSGHVIGVDMTVEMLSRARRAAADGGYHNVEFRLGEIEHIPAADASVDLIISNCVINLSPEKPAVFREAFRVLRPGGRLAISDPVLVAELPESAADKMALLTGCIAGALKRDEFLRALADAGFEGVLVERETAYAKPEHLEALGREAHIGAEEISAIAEALRSATIVGTKPNGGAE